MGVLVCDTSNEGEDQLFNMPKANLLRTPIGRPLTSYASAAEGGPVLDFCFFPSFNSEFPASCCFITSSQDHPIHLRDALTGSLRNTYRPFNHVDEVPVVFTFVELSGEQDTISREDRNAQLCAELLANLGLKVPTQKEAQAPSKKIVEVWG
ncbi:Telomerase Cajal body protein 1 [Symbiodinium microadriaticum]|uniref:Telomerase Cajal body protein 1 n=1 Tax=Symbiodinium microadriaticum TaxID=2951 RepID=A0A1Q9F1Y6_SYMMI|nr:Telomerase Cajal body protein 1 [Symbiodinium microadriaticum]